MRPECQKALEMYRAGITTRAIADEMNVTPATVRTYVSEAERELWDAEQRAKEQAALAAQNAPRSRCTACPWRTSGIDICVLPRCFKEAK